MAKKDSKRPAAQETRTLRIEALEERLAPSQLVHVVNPVHVKVKP